MMPRSVAFWCAVLGAAGAVVLLLLVVLPPSPAGAPVPLPFTLRKPEPRHGDTTRASWAVRAPFRRSRTLALVRYGAPAPAQSVAGPALSRPQLLLRGVVMGREPAAVVEGIPGRDGPVVVRRGDTLGGLRVRAIQAGRVAVTGYDSTWHLSLDGSSP